MRCKQINFWMAPNVQVNVSGGAVQIISRNPSLVKMYLDVFILTITIGWPWPCAQTFRIYECGSTGPVLFFLHGGGFSALSWSLLSVGNLFYRC